MRPLFEQALKGALSDRKSFKRVFEFAQFNDPNSNPVEKAEKIESWLQYDEGERFFRAARGAGIVTDLNPELGFARVNFEKEKRISVPLGAAGKYLTPIPAGHILREKFTDPGGIKLAAAKKQADTFARLLQSFGRPMTMPEVRDALIGIV